jgi:hypothetical protein
LNIRAPASDRYVSLSDNQRDPVLSDLRELQSQVRTSNDGDPEEREIALSEISAFEATLSQSRVSAELIDRFVNRVLRWIISKFSDALLGAVAGALVVKLIPFLAA